MSHRLQGCPGCRGRGLPSFRTWLFSRALGLPRQLSKQRSTLTDSSCVRRTFPCTLGPHLPKISPAPRTFPESTRVALQYTCTDCFTLFAPICSVVSLCTDLLNPALTITLSQHSLAQQCTTQDHVPAARHSTCGTPLHGTGHHNTAHTGLGCLLLLLPQGYARDLVHTSRKILERPQHADEKTNEILLMVLLGKHSIVQKIWNSKPFRDAFEDNASKLYPDRRKVSATELRAAKHRHECYVNCCSAFLRTAAGITTEHPSSHSTDHPISGLSPHAPGRGGGGGRVSGTPCGVG